MITNGMSEQMVALNRMALKNGFKALDLMYDQNQIMMGNFLQHAAWIPENGKKVMQEWLDAYRSGFDQYKKMVDDSFASVEACFSESDA